MRRAAVLALVLAALPASGSGGAPAPPLLRLTGPVKELAADGGRVAIILQTSWPRCTCARGAVWRLGSSGVACPDAGLGALRRCTAVRAGFGTLRLLSVAGGSVALLQPDGSVAVASASGVTSATIPFAAGELRAARLDTDGRT